MAHTSPAHRARGNRNHACTGVEQRRCVPICFGEATKFCQYLLDADKSYEATGLLGVKTNTGDAMGEIIAKTETYHVSEAQLQTVLLNFVGSIKQVPSMFSALKHQGTPLYKYARAGVDIPREARDVMIHRLQLDQFDGHQFAISVTCSKGTYIRNLVEDIGDDLGIGAHVTRLHRCYTAGFADDAMYTVDELQNKSAEQLMECLLPMDRAVCNFPRVAISSDVVQRLRQGKTVEGIDAEKITGCVCLYENDTQLIGLGELQPTGQLKVKRLLGF